jgi:hypothetical protein
MKPSYSGKRSNKFWYKINTLTKLREWDELYTMANNLQALEQKVLIEMKKRKKQSQ